MRLVTEAHRDIVRVDKEVVNDSKLVLCQMDMIVTAALAVAVAVILVLIHVITMQLRQTLPMMTVKWILRCLMTS